MSFWEVAAPTWLQGVGTVGAFVTGGIILLRELRRDRSQQELQERRQAGAISAWLIRTETAGSTPRMVSRCVLNNATESPVYDLSLIYLAAGDTRVTDFVGVLPPGRVERPLPDSFDEVWVEIAEGWLRKGSSGTPVADPRKEPWPCQVSLEFRDSSGVRWIRAVGGTLLRG
jgi:hypothetical protein